MRRFRCSTTVSLNSLGTSLSTTSVLKRKHKTNKTAEVLILVYWPQVAFKVDSFVVDDVNDSLVLPLQTNGDVNSCRVVMQLSTVCNHSTRSHKLSPSFYHSTLILQYVHPIGHNPPPLNSYTLLATLVNIKLAKLLLIGVILLWQNSHFTICTTHQHALRLYIGKLSIGDLCLKFPAMRCVYRCQNACIHITHIYHSSQIP